MVSTDASAAAGRHPDAAAAGEAPRVSRRTWLATLVLLIAAFMELMDVTMANVAVPSIQSKLGASYGQAQWVVAGYSLAFSVTLLTGGRLGDIRGRRPTFLAGLVGFVCASVLCGIAPNPDFLLASRVVQGMAAAVMLPQVLACISVWFPPGQREAAFGLFGAVSGLGGVTAPLIGGSLIDADIFGWGWRPIFFINVPIGLFVFLAALRLFDDSKAPRRLRLDPLGALVGALGVFLVVFPVIQGRDAGWPVWIWVMLGASVPVLALFAVTQRAKMRRDGSPVVDLSLFKIPGFSAALLVTLVFFAGVTALAFILMIYLQSGFGYTPFKAGLALVPLAIGLIVGSGLSIGLSQKLGRTTMQIGSAAGVGGIVWLATTIGDHTAHLASWDIVWPLAVAGIGIGIVVAPLNDFVLRGAPEESTGTASGLQSTMIQAGSAAGVALLGVILFGLLAGNSDSSADRALPRLRQDLVASGVAAPSAQSLTTGVRDCFHDRTHANDPNSNPPSCRTIYAPGQPAQTKAAVAAATSAVARDDFSRSMQDTLYWGAGVFALAGLLVFFMPGRRSTAQAGPSPAPGVTPAPGTPQEA
jgi:EmrB/QacA subfamily drug resistance transporter